MIADSSPSTPASVIETCWPTIEVFLDLEATVSIAQSCRSLHAVIIDAESNKIKVTHFEVDNSPIPSSDETPFLAKNWHTAPARIPHYLSRALNAIHFPSLRRLHLDFPATKRRISSGHADIIDDACNSSFPIFVANLSFAHNLEHLHLNTGRLMSIERSGQLESLYEIFAGNLGNCSKLRSLDVANAGYSRGIDEPLYSVALMRALTSIIRKRTELERLSIAIAKSPSDELYNRLLSSRGIYVVHDFFVASLSMKRLRTLEVAITQVRQLNALIRAAGSLSSLEEVVKPSSITKLDISCEADHPGSTFTSPPDNSFLPAAPLLEYLSECHHVESIDLELPAECWKGEETLQALRKLLENKPRLAFLSISLSFANTNGKIMKLISECLAPIITSKALCELSLFGLGGVKREDMIDLQRLLQGAGLSCKKLFAALTPSPEILDVHIMMNHKVVGEPVTDVLEELSEEKPYYSYQQGPVDCNLRHNF